MTFDHNLFLAINGLAGRWMWLDAIARFLANDWFLYLLALVILLLWLDKRLRMNVYLAISSVLVGRAVITEFLKRIVNRARPYEVLDVHQLIIDNEHGLSFPSGHATIFFAIAFAFYGTKYFLPLFVLAFLASLARVVVGVHYPLDILVGAVIGAGSAWALRSLFKSRFSS